jgi:diaminopimelate epimerase
VAVAAFKNGYTDRQVDIALSGGHLQINYDEVTGHVFMTGSATEVFTGEIALPWEK